MSGRSSFIVTCTGFLPKAFVSGRAEETNMQFYQPMHNEDFKDLSRAIQAWCRHFGADVGERETAILFRAAIELFDQGNRGTSALADALVKMYPGPQMLRINAPGSNALH
jgi:hypothetical protein